MGRKEEEEEEEEEKKSVETNVGLKNGVYVFIDGHQSTPNSHILAPF